MSSSCHTVLTQIISLQHIHSSQPTNISFMAPLTIIRHSIHVIQVCFRPSPKYKNSLNNPFKITPNSVLFIFTTNKAMIRAFPVNLSTAGTNSFHDFAYSSASYGMSNSPLPCLSNYILCCKEPGIISLEPFIRLIISSISDDLANYHIIYQFVLNVIILHANI